MRRIMLASLVASLALPAGCIVAVEGRTTHRTYSPPPPPPPAEVTVEWNDARTVVLREYYDCDWETVGAFEYYEDECGIPEDDLFFLLHVSRASGRNFHEVCFTYQHRNRVLWDVVLHYRINHWDLYIDLPVGTSCPPAYSRVYGYYWRRDSRIILTNYDCHALFWLRFGHFYYGWQPRECFVRWDRCVDDRVRFVTVVHREYPSRAGYGNRSWNARPVVKVIERPERDRTVIVRKRVEVKKKVEVDIRDRGAKGQQVVRAVPMDQRQRQLDEHRRKMEEQRNEEREVRRREPQKFEEYRKGERDDRKDDKKDDRRDDPKKDDDKKRDAPKDDRREPPKRNPPPPPKDDKRDDKKDDRKDDTRKDDDKKRDDPKDDRREPPKRNPPPPPKDDKKDDGKKDDGKKKDDQKDDRREPPKRNPPPPPKDDKKDDRKDDNKKDDGKRDDGKKEDNKKKEDKKKDDKKKDDGKKDDNQKEDNKKKKDDGRQQQQKQQPRENRQQERKAPAEKKQGEKKRESPKEDRAR